MPRLFRLFRLFHRSRLLTLCLAGTLLATPFAQFANAAVNDYLRADAPDIYEVKKGDTLWDISGRFLDRPWLWPEVWQVNPQIENPHLIYPGDRIRLVYVDGQPQLRLDRGVGYRGPRSGERLQPRVRSTPLESAIPTISLDAIEGFLVHNRVVSPASLDRAPYVIQGDDERLVLGAGDRLYVRGVLPNSASYNFVRKGPLYIDPVTEEVLGQEATYIGVGRTLEQNDDIATMTVVESREEVQITDRVLPTEERRLASKFFPSAPAEPVSGEIISVFSGVTQVGQYDVVVINQGAREGIVVGNVLAIHRRGALARDRIAGDIVRLPSERAGLMMVFRTFEKLSYGLVLSTARALSVGDEVTGP
ncbi:MAG: LysM peptidoglycan-binding domain-containing protein [Pseudomonadota bacterium]